jgi:hypothetical protein
MKTCTKCGVEKDECEFSKDVRAKDGLVSHCKDCCKEYYKEYRKNNKEKILEKSKNYYANNKDKAKEYHKENKVEINKRAKNYYLENKEYLKECSKNYRIENKEELKKRASQYRIEHKKERNEYCNSYQKARKETDPCFKLKTILRDRLSKAIRGNSKKGSAVRDLGCSIEEFKLYIEDQFYFGMSWNNYGSEWQIDHIIPFKDINVLDEEQLKMVLSYTNLRPCWCWANMARNYYNDNQIDFSSPTPKYFD